MRNAKLNICHLYPKSMNTYGDLGNIIALVKLCQWNAISVTVSNIEVGDIFEPYKYDLCFLGGGQDSNQIRIAKDTLEKQHAIKEAVETDTVFLLICGGYQIFCNYFKTWDGIELPGLSIFDAYTIGSFNRKIGNIIVESFIDFTSKEKFLVGFENHSGNTYLTKIEEQKSTYKTIPIGKVIKGFGNNDSDKLEGARYRNCFGSYMHGSLLPKNPHFGKYLLQLALEKKYKEQFNLQSEHNLEMQAHQFILHNRAR